MPLDLSVSFPLCLSSSWRLLCPFQSFWLEHERRDDEEKVTLVSFSVTSPAREGRRRGGREQDLKKACLTVQVVANRNQVRERHRHDLVASPDVAASPRGKAEMEVGREHYDLYRYNLAASPGRRAGVAPVHEDVKVKMTTMVFLISRSQIHKKTVIKDNNWCNFSFGETHHRLWLFVRRRNHLTYGLCSITN